VSIDYVSLLEPESVSESVGRSGERSGSNVNIGVASGELTDGCSMFVAVSVLLAVWMYGLTCVL